MRKHKKSKEMGSCDQIVKRSIFFESFHVLPAQFGKNIPVCISSLLPGNEAICDCTVLFLPHRAFSTALEQWGWSAVACSGKVIAALLSRIRGSSARQCSDWKSQIDTRTPFSLWATESSKEAGIRPQTLFHIERLILNFLCVPDWQLWLWSLSARKSTASI